MQCPLCQFVEVYKDSLDVNLTKMRQHPFLGGSDATKKGPSKYVKIKSCKSEKCLHALRASPHQAVTVAQTGARLQLREI